MYIIREVFYDFPNEDLYLNSFHFPLFSGITGSSFALESSYKVFIGFMDI